ncbi:MAG: sigma-E factor negative regulatory protein [Rugosibacter sp.]|nr:sigma-E factor negative regulatory protein RseA [Rugosibacter sp.]
MSIHISALIDGELDLHEMAQAIAALPKDDEGKASWHLYHVAGDAIREAMDETSELDIDVSRNVMAALSLEPTILAPHAMSAHHKSPRWQRPALALAASMAGAALVAWVALAPIKNPSGDMNPVARLANNPLTLALKNPSDQATEPAAQSPDQSVLVASRSAGSFVPPRAGFESNKPAPAVNGAAASSHQVVSANKVQLTAVESAQVARLQEYLAAHRAYHGSVLGGSANPIRTVSVAVSVANGQR